MATVGIRYGVVGRYSVIGLGLLLAGCINAEEAVGPPCPTVQTLAAVANVTKFRDGPGRDLTDVVMDAEIVNFSGTCGTDDDGRVDVDLVVNIEGRRGPAVREGDTTVDYFVAVTNGGELVFGKSVFTSEFDFKGNTARLQTDDQIVLDFKPAPGFVASSYDILIGFQLNEDERAYNALRQ